VFVEGRGIKEEPEPLSPGDGDVVRIECWEDWEKTILRWPWDNAVDKMRLEWKLTRDICEGGDALGGGRVV